MSFEEHSHLFIPPDKSERAWRYMDLTKFLSLLDSNCLYFSNLEYLAVSDPHEGVFAVPNYRHRQWKSIDDLTLHERELMGINLHQNNTELQELIFKDYIRQQEDTIRQTYAFRRSYFVNCWHRNKYESAAMWSTYAHGNWGIAITSSYQRMIESTAKTAERIHISNINYIDYDVIDIPQGNSFFPIIHKRMDFSFENEIRMIYWDMDITHRTELAHDNSDDGIAMPRLRHIVRNMDDIERFRSRAGILIPVNLDTLIDEIFVSPSASQWFEDLVGSLTKKFGFQKKVRQSSITKVPYR